MHMNVLKLVEETSTDEDTSADSHKDMTRERDTAGKKATQDKLHNESYLGQTKSALKDAEEKLDEAKHQLKIQEEVQAATAQRCNPQQTHEQKLADVQQQIE